MDFLFAVLIGDVVNMWLTRELVSSQPLNWLKGETVQ